MNIEKYERREKHNVSSRTLKNRVSIIKQFGKTVSGEPTVDDLEEYVDGLIDAYDDGEVASSTVSEYYKAVKKYYKVVLDMEDEVSHIADWIPDTNPDPGDYLETDEYQAFKSNLRGFRDKALIEIMYFFARRPTEVLLVNDEDIDMEENTITFNILKKTNDRDTVTLVTESGDEYEVYRATFNYPADALNSLDDWVQYKPDVTRTITLDGEELDVHPTFCSENGRISYNSVYKMVKQANERTGTGKNITPKSLRHSRITHLDRAGKSPDQIARSQALHSPNSDVIGRYIHERDESDVRDTMTLEEEE